MLLEKSSKDPDTVCEDLSLAVTNLSHWLSDHGLLLNSKKTQAMFIKPRGVQPGTLTITCCGAALQTVSQTKYLGVVVHDGLTWSPHVATVSKQVKRCVGALWRGRASLSLSCIAFVLPATCRSEAGLCFYLMPGSHHSLLPTLTRLRNSREVLFVHFEACPAGLMPPPYSTAYMSDLLSKYFPPKPLFSSFVVFIPYQAHCLLIFSNQSKAVHEGHRATS